MVGPASSALEDPQVHPGQGSGEGLSQGLTTEETEERGMEPCR